MGERKENSYQDRLLAMKKFESIDVLREHFLAKAGSLDFFREVNFLNYVRSVMDLTTFMEEPDPDKIISNLSIAVLKEYLKWLRDKGNAPGTQRLKLAHIKRWAVSNEVDLKWSKLVIPTVRTLVKDRAPTKTELRTIMNYAPSWIIPAIMTLASSGMRVGSLLQLKLKHLDLNQFSDIGIVEVPPDAAKGWVGYYTAITPEARQAIETHLAYRRSKGEKLGPESPLLRSPNAKGHTSYGSIAPAYNRSLKRAGLDEKSRGFHVLHLHTLRKFFRSQLEGVMTKSIREAMMGHVSGEYLDGAYLRIPISKLVLWYRKGISALTLIEDITTEEYERKQFLRQAALLLSPDKMEMLRNIMTGVQDIDEGIKEYHKLTRENKGTYAVVAGEEEMLRHLSDGYKLERELNGDKYLLSLS